MGQSISILAKLNDVYLLNNAGATIVGLKGLPPKSQVPEKHDIN